MKYIIFYKDGGFEQVVIFSDTMVHSDVARGLGVRSIISAGSVTVHDGKVSAGGRSVTLGKESRPEDSSIIRKALAYY